MKGPRECLEVGGMFSFGNLSGSDLSVHWDGKVKIGSFLKLFCFLEKKNANIVNIACGCFLLFYPLNQCWLQFTQWVSWLTNGSGHSTWKYCSRWFVDKILEERTAVLCETIHWSLWLYIKWELGASLGGVAETGTRSLVQLQRVTQFSFGREFINTQ